MVSNNEGVDLGQLSKDKNNESSIEEINEAQAQKLAEMDNLRDNLQSRVGSRGGDVLRSIKSLPINKEVMTRKEKFYQSPGFSSSIDSESKRRSHQDSSDAFGEQSR